MPPLLPLWLRRADPDAVALRLPDRLIRYRESPSLACKKLQIIEGTASEIAIAFFTGSTVFPLSPRLNPPHRARFIALAEESPKNTALIITTSGSENAPKAIRLTWRSIAAGARMVNRAVHLQAGDVWLAALPLCHIGGAMIPYRCWRAGATALIHHGFQPDHVLRDLNIHRVTHLSLVPVMLDRLLEADPTPPPPSLRVVLVGGANLDPSLHQRALAAGWPVVPVYGMTETCATATFFRQPLPGVRCRVTSSHTLDIATPARMAGYLGEPDIDEWVITQDVGEITASGEVHVASRTAASWKTNS
ncbi:MAG: AMP-binding protein [Rhodocyclaceae bacterium]|nr:AMP-binding protein [Rhodocyclaceae bacterium]